MFSNLWRVVKKCTYGRGMRRREAPGAVRPPEPLQDLDSYANLWIAVKDDEVIAAAHTSRDLVRQLTEKGPSARGAVAQFVTRPSDEVVIGVG